MKTTKAFSIIEIIIVIVIIAILASIVLVSYTWMRNDAMDAKLEATAANVLKAIKLKQTKTGTLAVQGNPRTRDELLQQYYLSDLSEEIAVDVADGIFRCIPSLSDGCNPTSGNVEGELPKDKVIIMIVGAEIAVSHWSRAEGKLVSVRVTDSGEFRSKFDVGENNRIISAP